MENRKLAPPGPIIFEGKLLEVKRPSSLLNTLLAAGIKMDHSCGGNATCGTCRVIVEKDVEKLPPRGELEALFAEERGFSPEERLSCQLECSAGLCVSRPYFLRTKNGLE